MHTQPFELGERVSVLACVWTQYLAALEVGETRIIHSPPSTSSNAKVLLREEFNEPIEGIIVGYTWRATGIKSGILLWDDDPPYLAEDRRHKVWLVAHSLRYIEPIVALEADIDRLSRLAKAKGEPCQS